MARKNKQAGSEDLTAVFINNNKEQGLTETASQAKRVLDFFERGLRGADNSARAFDSDLGLYKAWCEGRKLDSLPAQAGTLALYAAEMIEVLNYRTLSRHLSSINRWHRLRNLPLPLQDPQLKMVLRGIKLDHYKPPRQAGAFSLTELEQALHVRGETESDLTHIRDRALILLGFAGAFRRSELVSVNIEDITIKQNSLVIRVRKSKTNQFGNLDEKWIPKGRNEHICPYVWTLRWLKALNRTSGPLFVRIRKGGKLTDDRLAGQWVNFVMKQYFNLPGQDLFTAHSLRASFVTQAISRGAGEIAIMRQTKHKSSEMIRRYVRINDIRKLNAVNEIGY